MKNILLSYPRSGNTWIRYCVECVSKKPTVYPEGHESDIPIGARVSLNVNLNDDPILFKSHNISSLKDDNLILVIRDYKEAIKRHYLEQKELSLMPFFYSQAKGLSNKEVDYVKNIIQFDNYENNKLLVYYEDLIKFPEVILNNIFKFLDINDASNINDFFENFSFHKENGIKSYHAKSFTKGDVNKLKYHQINDNNANKMTLYLKDKFPKIFDIYLKKYE